MKEMNDAELLAEFAHSESEKAFTMLVNRHIRLVHSVALRHTSNPYQAEEITQAVFIIFARKARSLGRKTILSGWLYQAARLTAANFQRAELRRVRREQEAFMESTREATQPDTAWSELAPLLDDAMARLGRTDRDAVVLRYFENKSLQEVGTALGVGERTAQKRVSRALEKLRRIFTKRGVVSTPAIIAGAISANSVQAAPTVLATTISATALKGSAVAGSTLTLVKGTLHAMTWMKIKIVAAMAASMLIGAAGACVAIAHHHHRWHAGQSQAPAFADKIQAEREGGFANVAADLNGQKVLAEQAEMAEQKALRERQNQVRTR